MYWAEPNFQSFGDALWWSIVTTTTVGYGDLYPETTIGRIIASILMFVGIGLIGLVMGMVTAYFSREKNLPEEIRFVKEKIDNYPSITKDEIDLMIKRLENYKNKNTSG